jgi:hypothetical protein
VFEVALYSSHVRAFACVVDMYNIAECSFINCCEMLSTDRYAVRDHLLLEILCRISNYMQKFSCITTDTTQASIVTSMHSKHMHVLAQYSCV